MKRKNVDEAALDSDIKWTILGQKRGRDEEKEIVSLDLTDDLLAKDVLEDDDVDDDDGYFDEIDDEENRELEDIIKRSVKLDGRLFMTSIKVDEM